MDVTSFYELRERLCHAVIAGGRMLTEDYRLRRAQEALVPMEKLSPVFAKIGQTVRAAMSAESDARAGYLLDALSLLDAVLCTQAEVKARPAKAVREIEAEGGQGGFLKLPYSLLHEVLTALRESGSGHYSYLMELHRNQPEIFDDIRVKSAMVEALGASYGELADAVAGWLKQEDASIIRMLKKDFDSRGKREKVRRIQILDAVAKNLANDLYLSCLEDEKEVRAAAIYALRHCEENSEILMDLIKTERGICRKTASFSLASLCEKREENREFLRKTFWKKPEELMPVCAELDDQESADWIAEKFMEELEVWEKEGRALSKKRAQNLTACLMALPGKNGEKICEVYRKAAAIQAGLDINVEGTLVPWSINYPFLGVYGENLVFSHAIPELLEKTLLMKPDMQMLELAVELYERYGNRYLDAAVTGYFLLKDAEECCAFVERILGKKQVLIFKLKKNKLPESIARLRHILWMKDQRCYGYHVRMPERLTGTQKAIIQPLKEAISGKLIGYLAECERIETDAILMQWINPDDKVLCETLREYFTKRAWAETDSRIYLEALRKCGSAAVCGLAVKYFTARAQCNGWEILDYIRRMPGSREERLEEGRKICEMLKKGQLRASYLNVEGLEKGLEELRDES